MPKLATGDLKRGVTRPRGSRPKDPLVIDLFSHCGVYVNAQRVASGTPFLLRDGDRIHLGQAQLVVRFDRPDAPAL